MRCLTADTINGVTVCQPFADAYDVLGNEDFLDALDTLKPGELLMGIVDAETYKTIKTIYGVNYDYT
jgi:hypothetical protein